MSNILDPLSSAEIASVVSIVTVASPIIIDGVNVIFAEISLVEPDKIKVINSIPQDRFANCLIYQNLGNKTFQYVVNLTTLTLIITNNMLDGIIPATDYSNGVAFWPWMNWFESGYGPLFTTYIQNIINEPLNPNALQYRIALAKRGIAVSDIGDFSQRYTPLWNFEMSKRVPKLCHCKTDSGDCNVPEKIPDSFKGRYFLAYLLDNNSDELAGTLDGFFFIFDSSVLNSFGTPGSIVITSDEFIADPLPPVALVPTPTLYNHPAPGVIPIQPFSTVSPNPPSFQITGNLVQFDNWSMRMSVDRHIGLQFYQISFYDSTMGKYRPIIYKASISDAMVAYHTPKPIWARNYLSVDCYSYPLTFRLVTLTLGQDVPNTATLIDVNLFNNDGSPRLIPGAIAIYEEDGDLAWRSTNGAAGFFPGVQPAPTSNPPDPGTGQGARGRVLVFRTVFSGFFYCWIYTWRFYQDGSMGFTVRLGGFTTPQLLSYNTSEEAQQNGYFGEFIFPNIYALLHTHVHCARLDFQVDGVNNSISESNFCKLKNEVTDKFPYGTNPSGLALNHRERTLRTELKAVRNISPKCNRSWTIFNPNVNTPGFPAANKYVGYSIDTHDTGILSQTLKCSTVNTNLEFTQHNLHVTRYDPDEMYGSGTYPIQQPKDVGMGAYIKNDDPIENKDIVVWYTMSLVHAPDTEDFPYIQLHEQGFKLNPDGFFQSNPSIGGDTSGVGVQNFNNTFFHN